MPLSDQKSFAAACKAGELRGAYLFFGEEEYTKQNALRAARKAMFPDEYAREMGSVKVSGENVLFEEWFGNLQGELLSLTMFCPEKLIEVHAVDYDALTEGQRERLLSALRDIDEGTCVILYALPEEFEPGDTFPAGKRLTAAAKDFFESSVQLLEFPHEQPARLCKWVCSHFASAGIFCEPYVATGFIDYCSADMFTLSGEIEKLSCYLLGQGRKQVTEEDYRYVCRSGKLVGAFDFTNAVLDGRTSEAMSLFGDMKRRKEKPENILGGIADTVGGMLNCRLLEGRGLEPDAIAKELGMHPHRVRLFLKAAGRFRKAQLKAVIDRCADADRKIKTAAGDKYLTLELLILEIAGRAGR